MNLCKMLKDILFSFLVFATGLVAFSYCEKERIRDRLEVKFFLPLEIAKRGQAIHGLYNSQVCIAHGGGLGRVRWRNSKEAVLQSISAGFSIVEVDMLRTTDGGYIGAHDWVSFRRLSGNKNTGNEAMSYCQAKSARILGRETPVTFEFLREIMSENPSLIIDVDKITDYEYLVRSLPHPDRLMVMTYNEMDYLRALRAGVRYPVFCVWEGANVSQAEYYQYPILRVNARLFGKGDYAKRLKRLHEKGVTIFALDADVCDEPDFIRENLGQTCSAIYTERWIPEIFEKMK